MYDLDCEFDCSYRRFDKPKTPKNLAFELPFISYSTEPQGSRGRTLWGSKHGVMDYNSSDSNLAFNELFELGWKEARRMYPRDKETVRMYQWAMSVMHGRRILIKHVFGQVNWSNGYGLYNFGYCYG